jgi:hypothetical protein
MRHVRCSTAALTLAAVALATTAARAQVTTYTYRDDDGSGRLTVRDVGAAAGVEGGRQVQVVLEQGGRRHEGAGIRYQIQQGPPATTLLVFSLASPARTYFFQGMTRVGIVPGADGQGVYYRAGSPQQKYEWSVKEQVR